MHAIQITLTEFYSHIFYGLENIFIYMIYSTLKSKWKELDWWCIQFVWEHFGYGWKVSIWIPRDGIKYKQRKDLGSKRRENRWYASFSIFIADIFLILHNVLTLSHILILPSILLFVLRLCAIFPINGCSDQQNSFWIFLFTKRYDALNRYFSIALQWIQFVWIVQYM